MRQRCGVCPFPRSAADLPRASGLVPLAVRVTRRDPLDQQRLYGTIRAHLSSPGSSAGVTGPRSIVAPTLISTTSSCATAKTSMRPRTQVLA